MLFLYRRVVFEVFDWERLKKDEKIGKVFLRATCIFYLAKTSYIFSFQMAKARYIFSKWSTHDIHYRLQIYILIYIRSLKRANVSRCQSV